MTWGLVAGHRMFFIRKGLRGKGSRGGGFETMGQGGGDTTTVHTT